ncbi:MAG: hypothetical protein K6G38_03300 [Gammaproteobacteria bacterium]|nr:hypothetical protein [Gammaproteobacteria bacterium]
MLDWFNKQSNLVKFILLILPLVGWICELVVRWSAVLKKASVLNVVVALVYTFIGWAWILTAIDAILVLVGNKMLFQE